jgi:hypothetical protein
MSNTNNRPGLTAESLNLLGCEDPECDHKNEDQLVMGPKCHPGPVYVYYDKRVQCITLECAQCRRDIIHIQVAP